MFLDGVCLRDGSEAPVFPKTLLTIEEILLRKYARIIFLCVYFGKTVAVGHIICF